MYADYTDTMVPVHGQPAPTPEPPLYPDTNSDEWADRLCPQVAPRGVRVGCTRDYGHTGYHEAGGGPGIAARWDDDRTTDDNPPSWVNGPARGISYALAISAALALAVLTALVLALTVLR